MRLSGVIFMLFLFISCDKFNVKKTSSETILKEELQTFNWNEVDEYPTFSACDSTLTKDQKKQCFETVLINHITNQIAKDTIVVSEDVRDTITMEFQISEKGKLIINKVNSSNLIRSQIPNIDSLLFKSTVGLQTIYPAIKRGQQVKTEFKLPIIINVN